MVRNSCCLWLHCIVFNVHCPNHVCRLCLPNDERRYRRYHGFLLSHIFKEKTVCASRHFFDYYRCRCRSGRLGQSCILQKGWQQLIVDIATRYSTPYPCTVLHGLAVHHRREAIFWLLSRSIIRRRLWRHVWYYILPYLIADNVVYSMHHWRSLLRRRHRWRLY